MASQLSIWWGPATFSAMETSPPWTGGSVSSPPSRGSSADGRVPEVGETVRFLPDHCMMQKVHSGVIVHSEGRMVRIESIDLKVW